MLTTWKQARTSIELCTTTNQKKKKKSNRKSSSSADNVNGGDVIIGAQFVLQNQSSHESQVVGGSNNKKRRKFNNGTNGNSSSNGIDLVAPTLCLTSPHRVVFMENDKNQDDGLTKSKSRNYVTRPGVTSSFSLMSPVQKGGGGGGAHYDPISNLVYALRNGGKELAIWSAVSSSIVAGPDDDASSPMNGEMVNGKKRSKPHVVESSVADSSNIVISQRLQFPKDKVAVTLTPFTEPSSSKGKKKQKKGSSSPAAAAVGVAGCCNDGSIWVAICFPSHHNEEKNQFELLFVEGTSSMEAQGSKKKKKKTNGAASGGDDSWAVLDSRATAISSSHGNDNGDDDNGDGTSSSSILLSIQSVISSKDVVSLRNHQLCIVHSNDEGDATTATVGIESFTKQNVLQLQGEGSDVAVKLDVTSDSLSIVHRKKNTNGGSSSSPWTFTTVNYSSSSNNDVLISSMNTFPLPDTPSTPGVSPPTTIVSYGKLGTNVVAILMKSSNILSLNIIDVQRRAKLSTSRWIEGGGEVDDVLHGKKCHGMITNECDGSIALLMTLKGSTCLEIVCSKLLNTSTSATKTAATMPTSGGTSLASALRSAAAASLSTATEEAGNTIASSNNLASNLISSNGGTVNKAAVAAVIVDKAVDKACQLLATFAKELLSELLENDSISMDATNTSEITNGVSNGSSKKKQTKKRSSLIGSWKKVYQQGCMLIMKAQGGGGGGRKKKEKKLINGIRGRDNDDVNTTITPAKTNVDYTMPKRYVEAAFKESTTILLSLHNAAAAEEQVVQRMQIIQQEVTLVILEILQTGLISARADYEMSSLLLHCSSGNVLLSTFPFLDNIDVVGKLHLIDAMLEHISDIPEGTLVSILRFVVRNVSVEDVVAYYSSSTTTTKASSKKGVRLSNQYKQMMVATASNNGAAVQQQQEEETREEDEQQIIGTKLLSQAVLDFTSNIVTYSTCNHSFLTRALRDGISSSGEVETLLLTFAKLLKIGSSSAVQEEDDGSGGVATSLTLGAVHWISALTDAHMVTIVKIANEQGGGGGGGGTLIVDTIQRAVRSAMAQSEFANELWEIVSDRIITTTSSSSGKSSSAELANKSNTSSKSSSSRDVSIVPYSMERLAF